jgi:fatty acid/phospholipid biosynthesis enzyme
MRYPVEIFHREGKDSQWEKSPAIIFIRDTYYLNIFLKSAEGLVVWIGDEVHSDAEELFNSLSKWMQAESFSSAHICVEGKD